MAIYETDIKLLESQRLTDNEDGGGRLTGNEVVDGEANNLFPDISQLDRTMGRINMRKAYMAVMSPNAATYYGSHVIITEPPKDDQVHVALYDTGSWTDERTAARQRIESYVIPGTEWPGYLWGDHIEGQSTVRILQHMETELPQPNETMMLTAEEGTSAERSQYFRVTDVESSPRIFFDQSRGAEYERREVILTTSQPLGADYPGHEVSRSRGQGDPDRTIVRRTQVADAARYYGIRALEAAANDGELSCNIGSVMTPLVPATQAEEAVTDVRGAGDVSLTLDSGGETVEVVAPALTKSVEIELANRQQTYVEQLTLVNPGTVQIDYRSQGQWYRITDDGQGGLTGGGAGQIDYDTGSIQVSLLELPDVGTAIIYTWGERGAPYTDAAGQGWASVDEREFSLELPEAARPGTLAVTYINDSTEYTLTDDGEGNLTGDGTGRVQYIPRSYTDADGQEATSPPTVWFVPDLPPEPGSSIQIDGEENSGQIETFAPSVDSNGYAAFTLTGDIGPGTVSLSWRVDRIAERHRGGKAGQYTERYSRVARDDGQGSLIDAGEVVGTIDYSTGDVSLEVEQEYTYRTVHYANATTAIGESQETDTESLDSPITASYSEPPGSATPQWSTTVQLDDAGVDIHLLGLRTQYTFMPETLRFSWGGSTYEDNAGGLIIDPTGDALAAGTIDYSTGRAHVTRLPSDPTDTVTIERGIVADTMISVDGAFFRTPGPQRPGSLIVNATTADGQQLTAQAATNNEITGDGVTGYVDPETGVVDVEFPADVMPSTIRYSTVAYSFIPLDPDILGLDPVRLPQDGRVPMIRPGDVAVVHNTQTTDIGSGDSPTDLGRERLSYIHVYDGEGERVPDADVIADLDAGTVEVEQSTDSPAPFTAEHRIEDMLLVAETQITGQISFARPLTHDFPANESYLSTAVLIGDRAARVSNLFAQTSWNNDWSDDPSGDSPTASYNDVQYPIEVTNDGAIEERWALHFQNPNEVNVIGEYTGQVLTNVPIADPIAPTNPETGQPYFTIDPDGWGGGWSTGNLVRFNTSAANYPLWIARTILAGEATHEDDRFRLQIRGDAQ